MTLPLGVAPAYAVVGGISAQGHEGPGPGNSIFGARHTEFDRPWLATLSGRRNMQPNIAHHLHRIDADGVVRDPLGSSLTYRHDGYAAGTRDTIVNGPYGYQVYQPDMSYSNLQSLYTKSDSHELDKLANQLVQLQDVIMQTPELDPDAQSSAITYLDNLIAEYRDAVNSGYSSSHSTPQGIKFTQDAVTALASYANIYNETDLFPKSEALQANAIVDLLNSEMTGDSTDTLQFFMYRVQAAYLANRGYWSPAQIAETVKAGGFNQGGDYNFGAVAQECLDLRTTLGLGHNVAQIADTLVSADPAGQFANAQANAPFGNSGQAPSIWGTYIPTGSATDKVVNGVSLFDQALFDAAVAVHNLWISSQGNVAPPVPPPPPPQPNSGGVSPSGGSGTTTPTKPSDVGLIAGGLALALGALVYRAYA